MLPRLHALVLAGGAGTRFGGGKLLASWRGRPLLWWALEAAFAAPVDGVTLVTGADACAVGAAGREAAVGRPLAVERAQDWVHGLSVSLRTGLAATPAEAAGVFVFLGDMPRIPRETPPALAAAWRGRRAAAAAPVWDARRGHPVLLGRELFGEAAALTGDRGAGRLLDRLGPRLALVEAQDDGVLFDVDTRDALAG